MRNRGRGVQAAVAALAAAGVVLAVSDAGAQQGANEFPVGVDDTALRFKPSEITVSVGDKVVWDFTGSTTAHNVVSDNEVGEDPKWKDFATIPSVAGKFEYTFTQVGEYDYVCDLHRVQGMAGKIKVIAAPVATPVRTPRPLTTATPVPSAVAVPTVDQSRDTPAPTAKAGADKSAPVLSKVSVKRSGRSGARVKWTLSEAASLTVRFSRSGSSRAVRTVRLQGLPGTSGVTVRSSRFTRGRYSVQLEARDAAGNRSSSRTTVRIGR